MSIIQDNQPDAPGEEDLPVNDLPENRVVNAGEEADPNIPDTDTETIKTNETDMEVHHHVHDSHGKKNWRSYFWEFLMLFLAVFCGFLAEYQLEHYIEKQRAGDFASSLKADLTKDMADINNVIVRLKFCANKIDTLTMLMKDEANLQNNTADFYAYNVFAFIFPLTTPNESTLQQLLNSGSLRYFRNKALVDSIKYYNTNVQILKRLSESTFDFNIDFRKQQLGILEVNSIVKQISTANLSSANSYTTTTHEENMLTFNGAQLLTNDAVKLREYSNWCSLKIFYINNMIRTYKRLLEAAEDLLHILNK